MAYEHSPLPAKFGKSTIDNNKNEERAMDEETPKGARLPDAGIRALYTLENRWQAWLDVEAALARAQADLGIVPKDCADRIAACAKLSLLDRARIDEADKRTGHTIVPLVWELSRICGEPAGGWVHWGATTQNIVQTGDLLVLRQAHRIFIELILKTLNAMADLAERSADMVLPARTHGQHAVPATFGFKVAVWIDEFLRHLERFRQLEPRVFVAMLGGAAGTYASLGAQGPAVQAGIAKYLDMVPMQVPARTLGDHLAEYISLLGLFGATGGKIGREIYTLMKTEFGEAEEPVPPGTVGSSTMPQKRNPKVCQEIIAQSAELRSLVPLALEAAMTEHEADRATSLMIREATVARGHPHRRHADPSPLCALRPQARSGTHARQPRSRRRADHGGSRDARSRRHHRPAACARHRL